MRQAGSDLKLKPGIANWRKNMGFSGKVLSGQLAA